MYDERERSRKKRTRKILRSTVITVTDNRHELFEHRKDVHRKGTVTSRTKHEGEVADWKEKNKKINKNKKYKSTAMGE